MNTQSENENNAMKCARGKFQRDLVHGIETIGSASLRGKAKSYSGRYETSALNLIRRMEKSGVKFHIQYGPRGGLYSAKIVLDD